MKPEKLDSERGITLIQCNSTMERGRSAADYQQLRRARLTLKRDWVKLCALRTENDLTIDSDVLSDAADQEHITRVHTSRLFLVGYFFYLNDL